MPLQAIPTKKPAPWYKTEGVNGQKFPTKKAITEAVRAIVNAPPLNTCLQPYDEAFIGAVLKHHPEWAEKSAGGVAAIEVRMNVGAHFANRGLWLVKQGGGAVDISWVVAINAETPDPMVFVRDAARHAITNQIAYARTRCTGTCAICGGSVQGQSIDINHRWPQTFEALLADWLNGREVPTKDVGTHSVFARAQDSVDWEEYHRLFAHLEVTHSTCNRALGNRAPAGESSSAV